MAVLTKTDKADMVERILNLSVTDKNQVYWNLKASKDFETMIWHYLDVHKIDRFSHKGSELALAGCTELHTSPTFSLGIRNGNSLEIYLERV